MGLVILAAGDVDSPGSDPLDAEEIPDDVISMANMDLTSAYTSKTNETAMPGEQDTTTVYASEDGEELTFAQIAMAAAKDDAVDVGETDEGYLINGEKFTAER